MSRRRRDDSDFVEIMVAFRELPLWAAPIGAVAVFAIFEYALPALFSALPRSPLGINYGLMFAVFTKTIAWFLAAGILLMGVLGAIERTTQRFYRRFRGASSDARPSARTSAPTRECARCHGDMVVRVRRADGVRFWGCSTYPSCRHTLPILDQPVVR